MINSIFISFGEILTWVGDDAEKFGEVVEQIGEDEESWKRNTNSNGFSLSYFYF